MGMIRGVFKHLRNRDKTSFRVRGARLE